MRGDGSQRVSRFHHPRADGDAERCQREDIARHSRLEACDRRSDRDRRAGPLSATTANPILVEVKRGTLVESIHRGAIAIADTDGNVPFALGNIEVPVFPRSAVKLMQAIPLIESVAADAYGLDDGELAIACDSHSGEAKHLAAVRSLLAKSGVEERCLAFRAHFAHRAPAALRVQRAPL